MNRAKLDDIIALTSRLLAGSGFECIEAEWVGSDKILRLYIDALPEGDVPSASPEGGLDHDDVTAEAAPVSPGIGLDACVKAGRLLNESPEVDELVNGAFTLEVSSPGIERPLRSRAHFERYIGQKIQVKLLEKVQERRQGTGRLVDVSSVEDNDMAADITIETSEGIWTFPLSSLQKASLVYDWGEA